MSPGGLRPLGRIGSIKIKIGLLVVITVTVATLIAASGVYLGLLPGYSVPLAVICALLLTQVLARGMTSPIRELTAAARAMAAGDHGQRVAVTTRDEVGELAQAFNTMSAELQRVEQQRRDLVANVSHELRTPISALQAVLENIVDGVSEPDPATWQVALRQTERLSRLVADLLDLSRVDAGIVELRREPVAVAPLLRAVAAEAGLGARANAAAAPTSPPAGFVVDVGSEELSVDGDRARLHQLLANLADNARRHSGPAGRVTLRARGEADRVVVDVVDTGPGIPVADRESVFERFTTTARSDDGGTGLGLAIARWVTQLHGGTIVVADSDGGCDIRVTLPRGRPTVPPPPTA